ncbi:16S rRNA (guanine(966)-N(2))-methyltransferase RsmD [Aliiroseovarius lamellibrachiae]|uniref:16S rRNA (guanine(966)-N(2))-methyltransferase RsmD n=1 Tax=Aliiroseovarius lamellibrachiae TaxID=1924933 RepID=UPI001BE0BD75|nr:16S rRNA (guanine(966)-N(2))-methyltransferase RsmD [Aliiroseovarius lamellibrachiae]MBT2130207.1 16S rRNA (guanine(966)-N(2))-methyltransferase RsmD [Aliiroseovarius lamellibrachiae]
MRIISGRFRGLALASVGKGDAGAHLRPTTDRVRESLFSMLAGGRFGDPIEGAHVLDLFAGTGALGLEALSRGAAHVTLVDDGRKALSLIRENVEKCRCGDEITVISRDATRLPPLGSNGTPHNLIFLDPPYGKAMGEKALAAAMAGGWLAPDALIVWEENAEVTLPDGIELLDTRRYGDTVMSICEVAE